MKLFLLSALGLLAALLAGCGGGGSDTGREASDERGVPSQALASPEAFSQFVSGLQADEKAEPLAVGTLMPPTSETAEPIDG